MKNNEISNCFVIANFYKISQRTLRETLRPMREKEGINDRK